MKTPDSRITVVVVTFRGREFIGECLASLRQQTTDHELLVIDNASTDGTAAFLHTAYPHVTVLRQTTNRGFAGAVAVALDAIRTPLMALLNDDAVAEPGWLEVLATVLDATPTAGAVTSKMMLTAGETADPEINNLGVALRADGYGYDIGLGQPAAHAFTQPTEVFGFSGGAALIDVAALRAVGGSPERFFLYYEDVDMSWRLRLHGFDVVSAPDAVVHHRHSATIGQGTDVFHFHNERNRLLTVLRCAPLLFSIAQVVRFAVTTASLAAKRALRRPIPPAHNFRVTLRLRVLGGLIAAAPLTLTERQVIGRRATVSRAAVAGRWLGEDPLAGVIPVSPRAVPSRPRSTSGTPRCPE